MRIKIDLALLTGCGRNSLIDSAECSAETKRRGVGSKQSNGAT